MPSDEEDITVLLNQSRNPTALDARDRLYRIVADELRKLAHAITRGRADDPALQTTVLVNEAFLRLVNDTSRDWANRVGFYKLAHGTMRRILADHGRRRRPGQLAPDAPPQADPRAAPPGQEAEGRELLEAIAGAVSDLEAQDPIAAATFMLRFFHAVQPAELHPETIVEQVADDPMTLQQMADTLNQSVSTTQRRLERALSFLQARLQAFGHTS